MKEHQFQIPDPQTMLPPELSGYPVVLSLPVAWGDMDSFGHVNNVIYFRYFEMVRVELLTRVGWFALMQSTGLGPIVASTACRFRKPLSYPDTMMLAARVSEIGSDRVTVEHAIFSERWQAIAAEGPAVVVNYDYRENRKAGLLGTLAEKIRKLQTGEMQ